MERQSGSLNPITEIFAAMLVGYFLKCDARQIEGGAPQRKDSGSREGEL
jgi:hypothetical protein